MHLDWSELASVFFFLGELASSNFGNLRVKSIQSVSIDLNTE